MSRRKSWSDVQNIPMRKTSYEKRGNRWVKLSEERGLISENQHQNITGKDTLQFFRNLGGYERNDVAYTARGYLPVKNTSISPDHTQKIVREFDLDNLNIKNAQYDRRYGIKKRR